MERTRRRFRHLMSRFRVEVGSELVQKEPKTTLQRPWPVAAYSKFIPLKLPVITAYSMTYRVELVCGILFLRA
jgi:hypothetical protein